MPGDLRLAQKDNGPDFITRNAAFRIKDISGWCPAAMFGPETTEWRVWTCDGRVPYTLSREEFGSLMELLEARRNAA